MKLEAAYEIRSIAAPADKINQQPNQSQEEAKDETRGAFGRLIPVHPAMHKKLTQSGYRHDANFMTNNRQGDFSYYSHPVSGHKLTVDQFGTVQNYEEPKQAGAGGQRRSGGFGR